MDKLATLETIGITMIETGEEAGLRWGIALAPRFGAVNGYVQLPFGHPLYQHFFEEDFDYIMGLDGESNVEVHGGVTYFRDGIIGFDTLHFRDVWTDLEIARVGGKNDDKFPPIITSDSIYWSKELVIEETKRLARQLAEMK